jgi:NAD(P)-dependent dehydrogenase (short-subunit alcohol dehydrogenase family)
MIPPRGAQWGPANGWGLADARVLIAGATGGIGTAVARGFAAAGARVMALGRDQDRVDALVESLPGDGHAGIASDLNRIEEHRDLVERTRRELGGFTALVHFAAILRRRASVNDVTEEDWDAQLDTNLKSTFFLCREAARAMVEQGAGGRIVTCTSNAAWTGGMEGSIAYAASKGGLVSMTRGLARTYAPHGITVNTVVPGEVRTPMLLTGLSQADYEAFEAQIVNGRVAVPEEIVGTVLFLASAHAAYITGAAMNVTGGNPFF